MQGQDSNGGTHPRFGERVTSRYASDDNPTKHGIFVRTIRRTGRRNRGLHYELTDGKGRFWEIPAENCSKDECST